MKDLLYIILLASTIFAITFWLICEYQNWRKAVLKKEHRYEFMEENLKTIIETWAVNEKSYNAILVFFGKIYEHQGKTKWMIERTEVLYRTFRDKYKIVSDELESENEFSCEMTFGNGVTYKIKDKGMFYDLQ